MPAERSNRRCERPRWALASAPMRSGARGGRPCPGHVGHPAPALRRLPAVGHRHLPGPGAEQTSRAVRPERSSSERRRRARPPRRRPTATTARTPTTGRRRRSRRSPPAGGRAGRPASGSPRSGSDQVGASKASNVDDLRKGPGHYPTTPLPGPRRQHRHRRPPHDLRRAVRRPRPARGRATRSPSSTVQGTFRYKVDRAAFVVDPSEVERARPDTRSGATRPPPRDAHAHDLRPEVLGRPAAHRQGPARSCRRGAPLPPSAGTARAARRRRSAGSRANRRRGPRRSCGASSSRSIGLLWWWLFHRHPRWTTWFIGAIPFLVALFVFYTYLERLLPSNY